MKKVVTVCPYCASGCKINLVVDNGKIVRAEAAQGKTNMGGCMMANMPHVHQGRCHISFVKERGTTPLQKDIPPRLFLSGG
ncbi:hypothetical protein MJL22_26215, partial [Salmonella enterica subsp. enterica serovar Montevideo]|nr:hypothetical protein [Salmonella enterica subsp. enterica serovar Montevideo]